MEHGAKVFGIGLSKTGTTSLYAALHDLGYRTATSRHMSHLDLTEWISGDFSRDYLNMFDAATDLPVATYFRELDARYPGSKFILTNRDVDSWLVSIREQFIGSPDANTEFGRDVRLAQYGVTTFNEPRFRRLHSEHTKAVRNYFRDRPDDLLEMDLAKGDGWQSLCNFIGKPVPDEPFPAVQPKFQVSGPPGKQASATSGSDTPCFAFVIPVVHPDGRKVSDYGVVENVLRETLTSLCAQDHQNTKIVVVCHRAPNWADQCAPNVHFLTIGDHPAFAANRNHVQIDKGMKYTIGSMFAIDHLGASLVMLMDGDDFIHRGLAAKLLADDAPQSGMDGYIIIGGYHALVQPISEGIAIRGVFEVEDFDRTCGSCRVFTASELVRHMQRLIPDYARLSALLDAKNHSDISDVLIDHIDAVASGVDNQPDSLIRILGRHVRQHSFLDFLELNQPWAAKGCGHGNHDGRQRGDVHWYRITAVKRTGEFIKEFGLEQSARTKTKSSFSAIALGQYARLSHSHPRLALKKQAPVKK